MKLAGLLARAVILPTGQDVAVVYIQLLPLSRTKLENNLKDPETGEIGECMILAMSFLADQMGSASKTVGAPVALD